MIKIALVGHKTDLESDRQVMMDEGQKVRRWCVLFFHVVGAV